MTLLCFSEEFWKLKICVSSCDNIRLHHECEGGIEKSIHKINNWHHEACWVITRVDPKGRIFPSHPSSHKLCLPLNTSFYIEKTHEKDLEKIPEYAEMWLTCDMVASLRILTNVLLECGCSFCFFPTGWYGVYEIEFSHTCKNSRNPDLVCKNGIYLMCSKHGCKLIILKSWR